MQNHFVKTSNVVIEDARNLSVEEFVKKYKNTGEEQLSKTYFDIRKQNNMDVVESAPLEISKKTNKVISKWIGNKSTVFRNSSLENDFDLEEDDILIDDPNEEIPEDELEELKSNNRKFITTPIKNTGDAKKRVEKRNFRIKELLNEKRTPKDIIDIMAKEGIKVHAPQISAVKQSMQ